MGDSGEDVLSNALALLLEELCVGRMLPVLSLPHFGCFLPPRPPSQGESVTQNLQDWFTRLV